MQSLIYVQDRDPTGSICTLNTHCVYLYTTYTCSTSRVVEMLRLSVYPCDLIGAEMPEMMCHHAAFVHEIGFVPAPNCRCEASML